jgi:hypothetical protein
VLQKLIQAVVLLLLNRSFEHRCVCELYDNLHHVLQYSKHGSHAVRRLWQAFVSKCCAALGKTVQWLLKKHLGFIGQWGHLADDIAALLKKPVLDAWDSMILLTQCIDEVSFTQLLEQMGSPAGTTLTSALTETTQGWLQRTSHA